jgi:uncharacterized membrane protein
MTYGAPQASWDIGQLLSVSWNLFTKNAGLLIGASAAVIVALMIASSLTWGILSAVIYGPLMYGLSLLMLKIVRNQATDFNDLFAGFQNFVPALLAGLIISIGTMIGVFLCVLPGLFLGFIWMLTFFYMVDKKLDFWPALEASRAATMGAFGQWFVLWLVIVIINVVGTIPCGLGLLVTVPITLVMLALAYDRSEGSSGASVAPSDSEI